MVGEASLLHMSGPDIQQLFAQAAGVGNAVVGVVVGADVEQIDKSTFEGQLPSVHVHSPSNKGHELSSQRPGSHVPHAIQKPPAGQSLKVGLNVGLNVGVDNRREHATLSIKEGWINDKLPKIVLITIIGIERNLFFHP